VSKQTRHKAEWIILHGLKGPLYRSFRAWKSGTVEARVTAVPLVSPILIPCSLFPMPNELNAGGARGGRASSVALQVQPLHVDL